MLLKMVSIVCSVLFSFSISVLIDDLYGVFDINYDVYYKKNQALELIKELLANSNTKYFSDKCAIIVEN